MSLARGDLSTAMKWAVIASMLVATTWGVVTLSSNIHLFLLIHIPQHTMVGKDLYVFVVWSDVHFSRACSKVSPLQLRGLLHIPVNSYQIFYVKLQDMKRWLAISDSTLHKLHQPDP